MIKRNVILFPASFLMNLSLMLVNFGLIFFLRDRIGVRASIIGWFFAAGYGGYGAGCFLLRQVQNRISPPVSMFIALVISIFSLNMLMRSETTAAALVLYLMFSTAPAFYWPPLMGWFSYGLDDRQLSTAISGFNLSWSTGALLGPLFGGIFAETSSLLPFSVDIAVLSADFILIAAGLIFIAEMRKMPQYAADVPSGPASHEAGKEQQEPLADGEPVPVKLLNGGRGTVLRFAGWIEIYSVYIVLGLLNNIFPLFVRDTLGLSESTAGNILFLRGITTAVGFFIAGRFVFWHFNRKLVLAVQAAVAAVVLLLFNIRDLAGFYILFTVFGLLFSMAYSFAIFHGSAGAVDRGRRMGLFEFLLTLGVITGSIGGGYMYQYFSIRSAFLLIFVLIIAGLAAQAVIIAAGIRKKLD